MQKAMKIPDAKAAVENEWDKLETIQAWKLDKVKARLRSFWKRRETRAKSTLHHWWTCVISKLSTRTKIQKHKGRVALRGDIVKDDSGAYAEFIEQGHDRSKRYWCHCKTARLWWTGSRRNICVHPGINARRSQTAQNSEIRVSSLYGYVFHDREMAKVMVRHSGPSGLPRTKPVRTPSCGISLKKVRKLWLELEQGKANLFTDGKVHSDQCAWTTLNWKERSRIGLPCGRNWWKTLISMNQDHSLITCTCDALSVNANQTQILWNSTETCSTHVFMPEQLKN